MMDMESTEKDFSTIRYIPLKSVSANMRSKCELKHVLDEKLREYLLHPFLSQTFKKKIIFTSLNFNTVKERHWSLHIKMNGMSGSWTVYV